MLTLDKVDQYSLDNLVQALQAARPYLSAVALSVDGDEMRLAQVFHALGFSCSSAQTPLQTPFEGMTERDRVVVRLVVDGLSNKEIGARIGIPETSVKRALQRVFDHCGVRTRSQVVRLALDPLRAREGQAVGSS